MLFTFVWLTLGEASESEGGQHTEPPSEWCVETGHRHPCASCITCAGAHGYWVYFHASCYDVRNTRNTNSLGMYYIVGLGSKLY